MVVENTTIQGLITAMLVIIPLGGALRIMYCAAAMMSDEEERSKNKKRIYNILKFVAVAEAASAIVGLAYHYYN